MKTYKRYLYMILAAIIIISACGHNLNAEAASGSWKQSGGGWWYEYTDGSYPVSCWKKIGGAWYYFNSSGYMEANCYRDGYWLSGSGAWNTAYSNGHWARNSKGWWYEDAGWYPANCWLKINGLWYYFYSDGYMAHDTTIGGYHVGSDGAWIPGYKDQVGSDDNVQTSIQNKAEETQKTTAENNADKSVNKTSCDHEWVWATKTVHHDAVTHTEYIWSEEYENPVMVNKIHCSGCGRNFDDFDDFNTNDPCHTLTGYGSMMVVDHYETVPARLLDSYVVIDKEAFDVEVNDYEYCAKCGIRK